jgi:hypothetical protein
VKAPAPSTADIIVSDVGWGWRFDPVTGKADHWVRHNITVDVYQEHFKGGAFVVGKPPYPETIDKILASGLTIQAKP